MNKDKKKNTPLTLNKSSRFSSQLLNILLVVFLGSLSAVYGQTVVQPMYMSQMQQQPNNNYLAKSSAFKQEIARMEITVS